MPRVAADPSAYHDALRAARRKARAGTLLNAQSLARAIGATWRIVETWILKDPAFPVQRRGGQGTPWEFELIPVLDHLIKQARSLETARQARSAATSRLAGFGQAGDAPPASSSAAGPGTVAATSAGEAADRAAEARGLKALIEAQMVAHRLKVQQGQYVLRADAEAVLSEIMSVVQTETLGITATIDPAGIWPVGSRALVENEMRTMLVTVRDRLDDAISRWGSGGSH